MKFKTPRDCAAVSHGGVILPLDTDGSIEVDEGATHLLAAHGITPWTDEQPAVVITPAATIRMSRTELIAALEGAGYSGSFPRTLADLRKALRAATTAQTTS